MAEKKREEMLGSAVNSVPEGDADRPLVEAARGGDKRAFGELVGRYQKRVFRSVWPLAGSLEATEDIVQEAFVKAYLALETFEPGRPFYPWIAAIARNLAINQLKRQEREKPATDFEEYVARIPDTADNPLEGLIKKEDDRRFMKAVQSLPPAFRAVFVLRTFEEMSYEEIAKQLNISSGTVDSRLHRARTRLLELLKE